MELKIGIAKDNLAKTAKPYHEIVREHGLFR